MLTFPSRRPTAAIAALASIAAFASLALAAAPASAASIVFLKGGNVWLAAPDGSGSRQVTSGGGWSSPSQADDGTILAEAGTSLYRLNRNGGQLGPPFGTSFTGAPANWIGPVNPAISPDGSHQAYGGEIKDSGVWDPICGCWTYTDQFSTWWGSASSFSQPDQTLGQEDYVDPAWIDNSHLLMTAAGILIDQVATYTLGGADNSQVQWFSDPDQNVQALTGGAVTRAGDKLAFVANAQGGLGNEIRIYTTTGPPPEATGDPANLPIDQCNIGPNGFRTLRVSFSPDGQSLAYDAPDGIHLLTLTGWPSCNGITDKLIIPGASEPYFGPADTGPPTPAPAPGPAPGPGPISARCTVPRLHGLGLAAARRSLIRAHCRLGYVRILHSTPNTHRGLVIISQQPTAGGTHPPNTKVNVELGRPARGPHQH